MVQFRIWQKNILHYFNKEDVEVSMNKKLLNKIKTKEAVLGVVGLGYVGLPLAVEMAKSGYKTIGFDVQKEKVTMVNQGNNYISDVISAELQQVVQAGKLLATEDYSLLQKIDVIAICVPTPLDAHHQPDLSCVTQSAKAIVPYLHPDMLIILESTTYPGTTEEILKPILESKGLIVGTDFFLAFSPERVDPGNSFYTTKNTPKVLGGVTAQCTEVASVFYKSILEGEVHAVSSPAVAEMEKILENTFRNVNIGLVNEMAILCHKMGIDIWEVIEAAKTKPYGFMPFYPGPGVGGHCIPIDPFYLTWKSKEYKYHMRLIETAGSVNTYMPEFILERTMKILNRQGKALAGARILMLGVAYKSDIDDVRESPALEVFSLLKKHGADVVYHDPFVASFSWGEVEEKSVELTVGQLQSTDLVVLTTLHSDFDYEWIQKHATMIFDTKNGFKILASCNNIEKL